MPGRSVLTLEAEAHSGFFSGCPRDWGNLPGARKPLVVGIDGGYVRDRTKSVIEIIAGKSFFRWCAQATPAASVLFRRMTVIRTQAHDPPFSVGNAGHTSRYFFCPTATRIISGTSSSVCTLSQRMLDWFHITMRLKVLMQYARGLLVSDPEAGSKVLAPLESIKRYL